MDGDIKLKSNAMFRWCLLLAISCVLAAGTLLHWRSANAACVAPSNSLGTVNGSFTTPTAGSYTVWARIKAPNTTNNAIVMDIDGTNCNNVIGDYVASTNNWEWVNYKNGNTFNTFTTSLSAGTHNYTIYWTESGVQLDRVIFANDPACRPTGNGDNCIPKNVTQPPAASTPPSITLTSPSNNSTVIGTAAPLSATVVAGSSAVTKVEFYVNNTVVATDTTAPYSASWDSTVMPNGSHTVTAKAFDASQTATSQAATITVQNTTTTSAVVSFEAETMTLPSAAGRVVSDTSASTGKMLFMWGLSNGPSVATKSVPTQTANRITIRARGDQCNGAPQMIVKIDGTQVLSANVSATSYTDYTAPITLTAAAHIVEVIFPNDEYTSACDRNLIVDKITFSTVTTPPITSAPTTFEAETMTLPSAAGRIVSENTASNKQSLFMWGLTGGTATAKKTVATNTANRMIVRARGDQCNGAPQMIVKIDGNQALTTNVSATSYTDYSSGITLSAGSHVIEVLFPNDEYTSACDRNLIVDTISFGTAVQTATNKCDLNNDGLVNSRDVAIYLGGYTTRQAKYDMNADGKVDSKDLAMLLGGCK